METSEIKYLKEHQRKSWAARSGMHQQVIERNEQQNERLREAEEKSRQAQENSKKGEKPGTTIAATFAKEFEERNKTR
jgi:hypothetical protein